MSYYDADGITVHHGDCLDVLTADLLGYDYRLNYHPPATPDASVDAVVTDPPYGLGFMGKEWDSGKSFVERKAAKRNTFDHVGGNHNPTDSFDSARTRRVEGQRFQAWCQLWAAECLRVLKPGGHLLAFGGTRTSHRLACAIEDAGFEIRDSIVWLYGSGFPKSLNVGRSIDRDACLKAGTHSDDPDHWCPATTDGDRWRGFGTAAKPGHEPIVKARKPLAGTVAGNVLAWGTGALNIDATRIGTESTRRPVGKPLNGGAYGSDRGHRESLPVVGGSDAGRWPANVVLSHSVTCTDTACSDGCPVRELDAQSGERPSGSSVAGTEPSRTGASGIYGHHERVPFAAHGDSGGASRFFYTAKAGANERVRVPKAGAGQGEVIARTVKQCKTCGSKTIKPGAGGGPACGHDAWEHVSVRDRVEHVAHPTVKPLALIRWLVRLVTPPGGLVLDLFGGSGTTAEACLIEGFRCIIIEREAEYLPLIMQRIHRRRDPVAYVKAAGGDGGLFDLFGEPT